MSGYLHIRDAAARAGLSLDAYRAQLPELEAQGLVERRPGGYLQLITPEQRVERRRVARERVREQKREEAEQREQQRRENERKLLIAVIRTQFSPRPARAVDVAMSLSRPRAGVETVLNELVETGRLVALAGGYLLPGAAQAWVDHTERQQIEKRLQGPGVVRQ